MSSSLPKMRRILKLRMIEHRLARLRAMHAERDLAKLDDIARRVADVKASLSTSKGATTGQDLQQLAEMEQRLDAAQISLMSSRVHAAALHAEKQAAQQSAYAREYGLSQFCERKAVREMQAAEMRADANRPFRRAIVSVKEGA